MIEVACALIKNEKDQYLLVQRSEKMPHPLQWEFPGGKLRKGENALQAIQREIKEELALDVVPVEELQTVFWEYSQKKIALVPVICKIRSGGIILSEHCDFIWLTIDEVKKLDILEADRAILKQLNTGK